MENNQPEFPKLIILAAEKLGAKALQCTPRTIHRHMDEQLKQEKDKLNIDNEKI